MFVFFRRNKGSNRAAKVFYSRFTISIKVKNYGFLGRFLCGVKVHFIFFQVSADPVDLPKVRFGKVLPPLCRSVWDPQALLPSQKCEGSVFDRVHVNMDDSAYSRIDGAFDGAFETCRV